MPRKLQDQIVVITGASSGIGLETARLLGRRGTSGIVLAARNVDALNRAAGEIEETNARAFPVRVDVSDWEQVAGLAQRAMERFGRIDTWINCAAVSEYAPFEDHTPHEMERIVDVNLLGVLFGSKAAVSVFRDQHEGHLINVSSVEGVRGIPLTSVYSATKFAVRGFTQALRTELVGSGIDVSLALPASFNTPLFEHSRAKLGGALPAPLPPVYEPEVAAEAIAFLCENPRRELFIGGAGRLLDISARLSPALADWMVIGPADAIHRQISDRQDDMLDNLFQPSRGPGESSSVFPGMKRSLFTTVVEEHPAVVWGALAAGAGAAAGALIYNAMRRAAAGDGRERTGEPAPEESREHFEPDVTIQVPAQPEINLRA